MMASNEEWVAGAGVTPHAVSLEPQTHSPVVASMSEAPFDLDPLSELLDRAALARRLSMATTDEQAAVTLGRLAEELDVKIGLLAKEMVRGDW
jgi:hypothetical protein